MEQRQASLTLESYSKDNQRELVGGTSGTDQKTVYTNIRGKSREEGLKENSLCPVKVENSVDFNQMSASYDQSMGKRNDLSISQMLKCYDESMGGNHNLSEEIKTENDHSVLSASFGQKSFINLCGSNLSDNGQKRSSPSKNKKICEHVQERDGNNVIDSYKKASSVPLGGDVVISADDHPKECQGPFNLIRSGRGQIVIQANSKTLKFLRSVKGPFVIKSMKNALDTTKKNAKQATSQMSNLKQPLSQQNMILKNLIQEAFSTNMVMNTSDEKNIPAKSSLNSSSSLLLTDKKDVDIPMKALQKTDQPETGSYAPQSEMDVQIEVTSSDGSSKIISIPGIPGCQKKNCNASPKFQFNCSKTSSTNQQNSSSKLPKISVVCYESNKMKAASESESNQRTNVKMKDNQSVLHTESKTHTYRQSADSTSELPEKSSVEATPEAQAHKTSTDGMSEKYCHQKSGCAKDSGLKESKKASSDRETCYNQEHSQNVRPVRYSLRKPGRSIVSELMKAEEEYLDDEREDDTEEEDSLEEEDDHEEDPSFIGQINVAREIRTKKRHNSSDDDIKANDAKKIKVNKPASGVKCSKELKVTKFDILEKDKCKKINQDVTPIKRENEIFPETEMNMERLYQREKNFVYANRSEDHEEITLSMQVETEEEINRNEILRPYGTSQSSESNFLKAKVKKSKKSFPHAISQRKKGRKYIKKSKKKGLEKVKERRDRQSQKRGGSMVRKADKQDLVRRSEQQPKREDVVRSEQQTQKDDVVRRAEQQSIGEDMVRRGEELQIEHVENFLKQPTEEEMIQKQPKGKHGVEESSIQPAVKAVIIEKIVKPRFLKKTLKINGEKPSQQEVIEKEQTVQQKQGEDTGIHNEKPSNENTEIQVYLHKCKFCKSDGSCTNLLRLNDADEHVMKLPSRIIKNNTECKNSIKALASLPEELSISFVNKVHGMGVFTMEELPVRTQLGPVEGDRRTYRQMDLDQDLTYIWMVQRAYPREEKPDHENYFCMENEATSNWCRYLRATTVKEESNLRCVMDNLHNVIYLQTRRNIEAGEELVYLITGDLLHERYATDKQRICPRCNMTFESSILFAKHRHIFHTFGIQYLKSQCKMCFKILESEKRLTRHVKAAHAGEGAYKCDKCGKDFLSMRLLSKHVKLMHEDTGEHKCHLCKKVYQNEAKLKAHIKSIHKKPTKKCDVCGKMFKLSGTMVRHRRVHFPRIWKVTCEFCGKCCRDLNNLKTHLLTHTNQKLYECSVTGCDAGFNARSILRDHYMVKHNITEESMPEITSSFPNTLEAITQVVRSPTSKWHTD